METGAKNERKATAGFGESKRNKDSYLSIPPLPNPVKIQNDQNTSHAPTKTPTGPGDVDREIAMTTRPCHGQMTQETRNVRTPEGNGDTNGKETVATRLRRE